LLGSTPRLRASDYPYAQDVAELVADGDQLIVHLKSSEKILSFHGDMRIPLTAIRSVAPVSKPWLALRGWRMAGTAMRGVVALGTWKHGDGFDFCAVRKTRPAVQIDVGTGHFGRFIICVAEGGDAEALADQVAAAAGIARSAPVN
jgi:hypothetical protein